MKSSKTWIVGVAVGMLSCASIASPVFAQSDDPTGFKFLTIGSGARAVGLGETMVSDGEDVFVTEYNPAGLMGITRSAVGFSHNNFFQDTKGDYVAAAIPLGKWALGARVGYVGTGDIPRRVGPSEEPLGYYDAASGVVQAALARVVDERLSVGISAGIVVEHIESESAQSAILGIGARYRAHRNAHVGMAFSNVGPKAKFEEQEFRMPNQARLGGGWQNGRFALRGELLAAEQSSLRWHFGGEFSPDPRLAVRAGLRLGYDTQFFSAGAGVRTQDQRVSLDYAYSPYTDDLGSTHRFGATFRP